MKGITSVQKRLISVKTNYLINVNFALYNKYKTQEFNVSWSQSPDTIINILFVHINII